MLNRLALSSIVALSLGASASAAPLPKPATFGICSACHKVEKGAPNTIGPNLWAVGGTKAGDVKGFAFSPAMKNSKVKWTKANLVAFIQEPQKVVPGNRMPFGGLKNPESAAAIADYILSLK
ncbi:MAG: c-type cytochrome [Alphaproteobacteria bacterium]|nr:MAG: c-type cytochrome [Alphaproteobacteria bacterium]